MTLGTYDGSKHFKSSKNSKKKCIKKLNIFFAVYIELSAIYIFVFIMLRWTPGYGGDLRYKIPFSSIKVEGSNPNKNLFFAIFFSIFRFKNTQVLPMYQVLYIFGKVFKNAI